MKRFSMMILGAATSYHQPALPAEWEDTIFTIDSTAVQSPPQTANMPEKEAVPINLPPMIPSGKRVLIVGDSLGLGFGPPLEKTLRENNYEAYLHAILGSTTKRWLSLIGQDLARHKPSLVIVSLGTNDSVANEEWLERNKEMYSQFAKKVEDSGAKLIWILPPEFKRKLLLRSTIVRQHIIDAVPMIYDTRTSNIPLAEDGIHSTPVGYKMWADCIWNWMLSSNIVAAK